MQSGDAHGDALTAADYRALQVEMAGNGVDLVASDDPDAVAWWDDAVGRWQQPVFGVCIVPTRSADPAPPRSLIITHAVLSPRDQIGVAGVLGQRLLDSLDAPAESGDWIHDADREVRWIAALFQQS